MDASSAEVLAHESHCDVCGYPRRGLTDGAHCPECGEPPPRLAREPHRTTALSPVGGLTAARLAHYRAVAAGLVLLVLSSVTALSVTLVMDVGPLTIPSLNVPAPKVFAAALVQRSIGGRPGTWGVSGTTAALLAVVAVWLITSPRSLRADEEPTFSLRRLARWAGVLTVGGALGLLLSGADPYIPSRGDTTASWVGLMVLLCELPANGLLYAYLWRLAVESKDRRATTTLERCAWLIPLLAAGAGVVTVYASLQHAARPNANWPTAARGAMALYGAAAVAVGAGATAGALRLTVVLSGVALSGWAKHAGVTLARLPRGLRTVVGAVRREPGPWAVFAGLLLWVWQYWGVVGVVLADPMREGLHGNVPMLDFPGPKVPVAVLAGDASARYRFWWNQGALLRSVLLILAAASLMTWPSFPGLRRGPAVWTRRAILVLCGLALVVGTLQEAKASPLLRHTRVVAFGVTTLGTAATALVYLRLAAVAGAIGRCDLRWRLAGFGVAAAALDLLPLGPFGLNPHAHDRALAFGLVCAAQVAGMFVLTFFCIGALTRLAWALGTGEGRAGAANGLANEFDRISSDRPVPARA